MMKRFSYFKILVLGSLLVTAATRLSAEPPDGIFARDNLVAWCIVPFDTAKRGPEERAQMLKRLNLKRIAYDWRPEHVPSFEDEILAYQRHGIEFFAFWDEHEDMFRLFEKYKIAPQIWKMIPQPDSDNQENKIDMAVQQLQPLVQRARQLGCKLGLYNHGGWAGESENLVAVCRRLRELGADHVGIVYNFHHGHEHIRDFQRHLEQMRPYLLCININGMNAGANPKILPVGDGQHEVRMLQELRASGYAGPLGILNHREDLDAEIGLKKNLDGLDKILPQLTR